MQTLKILITGLILLVIFEVFLFIVELDKLLIQGQRFQSQCFNRFAVDFCGTGAQAYYQRDNEFFYVCCEESSNEIFKKEKDCFRFNKEEVENLCKK